MDAVILMNSNKAKKIANGIIWGILILLLISVCYVFGKIIVCKKNKKPFDLFGYTFNVVVTDSMEPEIMVGDMVICKKTKIENVNVGDYIIFTCINPNIVADGKSILGQPIIHACVGKEIVDGEIVITTQGVNERITQPDTAKVTKDNFIGIMVKKSPSMGRFASFVAKPVNIVLTLVYAGAVYLIATMTVKTVKTGYELKKTERDGGNDDERNAE